MTVAVHFVHVEATRDKTHSFFLVYHHKSIACLEHLVLVLAQKNAFAGCEVLELNAYVLNK